MLNRWPGALTGSWNLNRRLVLKPAAGCFNRRSGALTGGLVL